MLTRYMHCYQCVYLINLRRCTPNRSVHYIQKSSDFFDVILLFSSLIYGIKQAVIVGLNSAKQPVIVGFSFNTSTVVFFFTFVNVAIKVT